MAALLIVSLAVVVPLYTGGVQYNIVLTASMEPAIGVGDVVAIEPVDPEKVQVGDIIAFRHPEGKYKHPIIHRVIEIDRSDGGITFKTQGDNLEEEDPWTIQEEHVVGQVGYTIPKIGILINALRGGSQLTYLLLILLPAAALIYDEIRGLMHPEEDDEPSDPSGSLAARLVRQYSEKDEDGEELSMIAWIAGFFVPDDVDPFEEPFAEVGSRKARGEGITVEMVRE